MKKSLIYLLLFFLSGSLKAQTEKETDSSLFSFFGGGFLQIHGGGVYNMAKDFESILNKPPLIKIKTPNGELGIPVTYEENKIGYTGGFKSMGIFENGIMLGIGLDYNYLNNSKGVYEQMTFHGASAQGYLGKTLVNRNSFLLYPYLGIGYYRYLLNIKNIHPTEQVRFDYLNLQKPGEAHLYSAHYAYFEVGIGVKKRIANKVTVGLDLGGYFSTTTHNFWKKDNQPISERPAPGLAGAFVKLTIDLFQFGKKSYILDTVAIDTMAVRKANQGTDLGNVPPPKPKKVNKKKKDKEPVNYNELYFNFGKEGPPPPLPKPAAADSVKTPTKRTIRVIDPNKKKKKK